MPEKKKKKEQMKIREKKCWNDMEIWQIQADSAYGKSNWQA